VSINQGENMKYLVLLFVFVIESVMASTPVKIIWPFGPVAATVPIRTMAENANAAQKEYSFVLEFATGGGGSVAVNTAAQSKQPAILAHSSAFFVTPLVSADGMYDINEWRMIQHICDVSFAVASIKYKSIKDLPRDRAISIGHTGVNSTTHFVMEYLAKTHNNMTAVPYKSSNQAIPDLLGGHVEMVVSLPGDLMKFQDAGQLSILGITGRTPIGQIPTLASLGYSDAANIVTGYYFFVRKGTDPTVTQAWQSILAQANNPAAEAAMKNIYCRPSSVPRTEFDAEFSRANNFWQGVVRSVAKK
jgi:tripartite-type tricarboxylate transporter receptor subunit TctC